MLTGPATLSTADLRPGQRIDVVVSLARDEAVRAVVLWADDEQFVAVSVRGLHRGWVGKLLADRGLMFFGCFASDMDNRDVLMAWAAERDASVGAERPAGPGACRATQRIGA